MAWLRGNRKTGWRVEDREGGRGTPVKPLTGYFDDHGDALAALKAHKEKKDFKRAVNGHALCSTPIPVMLEKWKQHQLKEELISEDYGADLVKTITRIASEREWTAIRDITKPAVKAWRLETKGGTVGPLRMIKSLLNWIAIEAELPVDRGVFDVGKKEKKKKNHRPRVALHTDGEAQSAWRRAFNIGGFSAGMAVEHLLLFPCRPIDVARCLVRDWDSANQVITYRKTKNKTDVPHWVPDLHARRLDTLAAGRGPDEPLFLDPWGRPWRTSRKNSEGLYSLDNWYYANVGRALFEGRQRGIYRLKSLAMTRLNKAAEGDRRSVTAISGHLSPEMVDLYAGTNIEAQRELLEKLPALFDVSQSAIPTNDCKKVSTAVSTDPVSEGERA